MSTSEQDKVVQLYQRDPQAALKRLNRITGLRFSHWPESLVQPLAEEAPASSSENDSPLSTSIVA